MLSRRLARAEGRLMGRLSSGHATLAERAALARLGAKADFGRGARKTLAAQRAK